MARKGWLNPMGTESITLSGRDVCCCVFSGLGLLLSCRALGFLRARKERRVVYSTLASRAAGRAARIPGAVGACQGPKQVPGSFVSRGWGEHTAPRVGQGLVQERPSSSIEETFLGVLVNIQQDFIKRTKACASHSGVHWAMWGFGEWQ